MKGETPRRGKTAVDLPVRPLCFAGAEVALKSVQFASVSQSIESDFSRQAASRLKSNAEADE
jgi:hypothetical protein